MSTNAANWYPDPTGRYELRYYDGAAWTDHVSSQGAQQLDPIGFATGEGNNENKVRGQVTATGYRGIGLTEPAAGGGGTIFDEPILVVNQKAKLIELSNQYSVFDQQGTQLAAVNQVGQSKAKKAMRLLANVDQFLTHKLQITDAQGRVLLHITRPAKFVKSTVIVGDHDDREIGRIVQQNAIGKINFALESGGQTLGSIKAENWRAWNFRIEDHAGNEIARITKTWEGLAKTMFTTADNYVVQVHQRAPEPLNSLVIASALSIDTALKQDSRGLN